MWRLALLAAGACGRVAFDVTPLDGAAGPSDGAQLGPWSQPVLVTELAAVLGAEEDDDPTLPSDMLEIFFASTRAGGLGQGDIWVATRASRQDLWGAPARVDAVSSAANETTPKVSSDGLTLYFAADTFTVGDPDIYVSTRGTRAAQWSAPVRVAELSSSSSDESAVVTNDGLTLYLDSTRLSASIDKIFVSTRASTNASWSPPAVVTELDAAGEEETPFPEVSGLALWGTIDTGAGQDLAITTRASTTDLWGPWTRVDELASPQLDADAWVSDDSRTLYMTSERSGAVRIYTATR